MLRYGVDHSYEPASSPALPELQPECTAAGGTLLPDEIRALLADQELGRLLGHLLAAVARIGRGLRDGRFSNAKAGSTNQFGDEQLDVDLKTDRIMFEALRSAGSVRVAASEENPTEVDCGGHSFAVAFDPLDGSSIVDANFAVGTIVGVWPGHTLLGRRGCEQAAALMAQYGPRVTVACALGAAATRNQRPAAFEYSGGLVPDVYHILIKGQGVLANASSSSAKAKLRLMFECAPIALIVEAAGGDSCVCGTEADEPVEPVSLLQVKCTDLDQRVGVCYGSAEEVARFRAMLFP